MNHYAIASGSGGGTRHFDLAKQLIKDNYKVTIFASSFDHYSKTEKVFKRKSKTQVIEEIQGVEFLWIRTTSYQKNNLRRVMNMVTYTLRSYRASKKMDEKPDIVIGSLMHPMAAVIGYLIAKRFGAKFYFEERDLWPQTLIDLGKISSKHPITRMLSSLELFLYKKADRIIVLFENAERYIRTRGIEADKVVYLPNGVDLERFDQSIHQVIADEKISDFFLSE
ncbi:glycosyltransferase family 4 protein [Cohnella cellulosilytica]|uniref:glycosyltransferase family 4 protein n=1 Tax=Cohnella cellulosilytica TaxID=986710 RepID=UPI00366F8F8F